MIYVITCEGNRWKTSINYLKVSKMREDGTWATTDESFSAAAFLKLQYTPGIYLEKDSAGIDMVIIKKTLTISGYILIIQVISITM